MGQITLLVRIPVGGSSPHLNLIFPRRPRDVPYAMETAMPTTTTEAPTLRALEDLKPPIIFDELRHGVLGQRKALRFVSVAIYKHTTGKAPGNLLMIGNSGTGKTTIMNNIQRLYNELPEYEPFRAVTIINANLLVDADRMEFRPDRLLQAVEQRARAIAGAKPTAEDLTTAIERATICIDEIDKMAAVVAGKPNAIGVVLQQGLLTLMEGEVIAYPTHVWENGEEKRITLSIDTGRMMFICGGAFEGLYDQVYNRVLKPGSGEKLRTQTIRHRRRQGEDGHPLRAFRVPQTQGSLRLRHGAPVHGPFREHRTAE